MPRIDTARLRRFVAQKEAAHAAMIRANEHYREAKQELTRAREALHRYDDSAGAISAARTGGHSVEINHRARYVRSVEIAQEGLNAAEAAQEAASETWQHASALGTSAINYARDMGHLPADMEAL